MRKKNYLNLQRRNHRSLKWAPLVFVRTDPKLYLEFNSKATSEVAGWFGIDLAKDEMYGVTLALDLARMEIVVKFLGWHVPIDNKDPFRANLTIMSDQRDQFRISCAGFMRLPQFKAIVRYLDLCESDFGVVRKGTNGGVVLSFNPAEQTLMVLRLNRPMTSLADVEPAVQRDLVEAILGEYNYRDPNEKTPAR